MELRELLRAAGVEAELRGDASVEIRDLAYDNRRVGPGTLFFCFPGERTDGHDFAPAAIAAGGAGLGVGRPVDSGVPHASVQGRPAAKAPPAGSVQCAPAGWLPAPRIYG